MRDHEKDDLIVSVDSFNNKDYKGDDDFEEWMKNEAPFVPDENSTTFTTYMGHSKHTIDMGGNYTVSMTNSKNWQQKLAYNLPIDLLYKLYPSEMKGNDIDDDFPF